MESRRELTPEVERVLGGHVVAGSANTGVTGLGGCKNSGKLKIRIQLKKKGISVVTCEIDGAALFIRLLERGGIDKFGRGVPKLLQEHKGSGHLRERDESVGRLTRRHAQAVDVGLLIVAKKVLEK